MIDTQQHVQVDQCIVCGSKSFSEKNWKMRNNYKMGKCESCGFMFAQPRPSMDFLVDYYNSIPSVRFTKNTDEEMFNDTIRITKLIKKYHPTAKKILEVGCSTGYYLHGLRARGYEVLGTELSNDAVKLAKEWYDIDVFNDEFPPPSYENQFDVIIIHHVIEHVRDPKSFLDDGNKYLSNGGIFIIETPNVKSMGIGIYNNHYPVLCPPGHLNFFSQTTLQEAAPENHKIDLIETTSYSKQTVYNCINATLSAIGLKKSINFAISKEVAVETKEHQAEMINTNKKYSYMKVMFSLSKIIQTILFPVFYLLDKNGKGENLNMISRKNN